MTDTDHVRRGWVRFETQGAFPSDWDASPTPYFESEDVEGPCIVLSGPAIAEYERGQKAANVLDLIRDDVTATRVSSNPMAYVHLATRIESQIEEARRA